jgi:hypothetical protein
MFPDPCQFSYKISKFVKKFKKYYEVYKESELHVANGTYNPRKLPKRGQCVQNSPYCVSHVTEIW